MMEGKKIVEALGILFLSCAARYLRYGMVLNSMLSFDTQVQCRLHLHVQPSVEVLGNSKQLWRLADVFESSYV